MEGEEGGIVGLPSDLDELATHIREVHAQLLLIDPIVAAISTELDAHKDQHVRAALATSPDSPLTPTAGSRWWDT